MGVNDAIWQHLANHDGVITMAEACSRGSSRHSVARRVTSDEWVREAKGVYRGADHPKTLRARVRIAVASVGPTAVLSGPAAAWWLDLASAFPPTITVIARAKGRHRNARPGVAVTHRRLADTDVEASDELEVTSVALTVLDTAAEMGPQVVDNALLLDRVTVEQLAEAHARYPSRTGAGRTRLILGSLASGARSEAERVTVGIYRDHGITGWSANRMVEGHLVDFVFAESMVIIEIDGFAFHRDAATFQRDRTKRNKLIASGWTVLNFTWDDITRRPGDVAAQVRSATTDVADGRGGRTHRQPSPATTALPPGSPPLPRIGPVMRRRS
ncbi:type IV toxin-antitoxin system AbiEi family antitoxin domain-containing protein [Gordonia hankookensis]|uniref:DUF559 domain-containing protein n=1 Tax=Gordonia hankookensis TaxID=589403 RepID=A0ABR7WB53_9ACTN|nr:type IV toxin-antitoxin system AbiEi family antitoxin domain-containing protein [Gordonia hankookensis]MBD1318974.1 DUF559 domain-containing protein [Gordonia hankookensis]